MNCTKELACAAVVAIALLSGCLGSATPSGDKIIEGEPDSVLRHPWMVRLERRSGGSWSMHCGGVSVGPSQVVTAAHCIELLANPCDQDTVLPLRIVAGSSSSENTQHAVYRDVSSVSVHADRCSDRRRPTHDFALLELSAPLPHELANARLASASELDAALSTPNAEGTILGWGLTENDEAASWLRSKTVSLLRPGDAPITESLAQKWSDMVVILGLDGASCNGDSGGPLMDPDGSGRVLGLISQKANPSATSVGECSVGAVVPSSRIAEWIAASRVEP